jgi:alpha-ribazole phosphatase
VSRLILIRHCEPEESARGRIYGTLDVGLSARGRAQAVDLADRMDGIDVHAIRTSPRRRARETAEPLAAARRLRPLEDDDLRELDFGELEGRTFDEIAEAQPQLYKAWMETPTEVRFPGGECYADLKARSVRALERAVEDDECVVVVTHGGVVRAALAEWLHVADDAVFRLDQRYGGITVVDLIDGFPLVRLVNGHTALV